MLCRVEDVLIAQTVAVSLPNFTKSVNSLAAFKKELEDLGFDVLLSY